MMTDAAHGTMSAQRTSVRPGKRAPRSCASASDSKIVTATTTATQTTVFATTMASGSCRKSRV